MSALPLLAVAARPATIPIHPPTTVVVRTQFVVPEGAHLELETAFWNGPGPCPHPNFYYPPNDVTVMYVLVNQTTGERIHPFRAPALALSRLA